MKSYFKHLRAKDAKQDLSTFEQALFPPCPWEYFEEAERSSVEVLESYKTSEKLETLQSLAAFVSTSAEAPKVSFPGGEISQRLTIEDDFVISANAPALETPTHRVLALGDLMEKEGDREKVDEVNAMITRMLSAMKMQPEEWVRKPSLRYFIGDDGDSADNEEQRKRTADVTQRLFQFIYKKQIEVVLAFGAVETRALLGRRVRLASIHGKFLRKTIKFSDQVTHSFIIIPLFHPEYLRVNPSMRQTVWADLQEVMGFLGKA